MMIDLVVYLLGFLLTLIYFIKNKKAEERPSSLQDIWADGTLLAAALWPLTWLTALAIDLFQ